MKTDFLLLLLILELGCHSPSQPVATSQQQTEVVDTIPKLPCEDPNWALDDTLFRSTAPSFFHTIVPHVGFSQKIKLENGFLGVIASSGKGLDGLALALYQTDSLGRWKQTYCGEIDGAMDFKTSMIDLNFDGHKDFLIDATSGGTFGNFAVGFLYKPQSQTFHRDTALNLSNLTIDTKNKRLRSRYYSSIYGGNSKRLYGWEGDSLVLLEEAIYHAYHPEVDAIIHLKKRQKDGTMKQDSIMGKMDPLWDFFEEKCVWKGDFFIN